MQTIALADATSRQDRGAATDDTSIRDAVLARQFEENGWLLVRSVFPAEEVRRWRELGIKAAREGYEGDLLAHPYLSGLVYDPRILGIVKAILGAHPVYFCDSLLSLGWVPAQIGFHRDNVDRLDGDGPDWAGPYPIVRFGIYLQDHSKHSGGLGIRERTHQHANQRGRARYVDTCVGDLVLWSHRTMHTGFAGQTRFDAEWLFPIDLVARLVRRNGYRLPGFLFTPLEGGPSDRGAFFCSYGARGAHLDRYLTYLKKRTFAVLLRRNSKYSPEVLAAAARAGLDVLDLREEAERIDLTTTNPSHYVLTY